MRTTLRAAAVIAAGALLVAGCGTQSAATGEDTAAARTEVVATEQARICSALQRLAGYSDVHDLPSVPKRRSAVTC